MNLMLQSAWALYEINVRMMLHDFHMEITWELPAQSLLM